MKSHKRTICGCALTQLLLWIGISASLAKANDIEPGKEFYTAVPSVAPIKVDGDLTEWVDVPVLVDPKFAVPKYSGTNASPHYVLFEQYDGGTWSGPDDQTSAVQVAYDAHNVYFGFVVTDDYHENMSGNAWNGDSVQLMIAEANRTQQIALYNYALLGYEDQSGTFIPDPSKADPVMIMHEAGPGADPACNCATSAVIKRDSAKHKTFYEIRLPKAALGLTSLLDGPQFGLGMAINDGDGYLDPSTGTQYGQEGQEGQKGWGGLGAHSIVFGKTPLETALITLGNASSIDTDGDGLPDLYELAHGSDPDNPSDAGLDSDGDGTSNVAEYLAGTDPAEPTDFLHVSAAEQFGNDIELGFQTVSGKVYQLQRSDISPSSGWQPAGGTIAGDGTFKTAADPGGANVPQRFYRIVIVPNG